MKKIFLLHAALLFALSPFAQVPVKLNVVYAFTYVRDLDQPENPFQSNMILSIGKGQSRYCPELLYNDNDPKAIAARKKAQEKMENAPSGSIPVASGGPMLTVSKYGALVKEEIHKNFVTKKMDLDARVALRTYHVSAGLPDIIWSVVTDTKKIGDYDCQKATGEFAGRSYEAWFTTQIPYPDGPWKLHGLPGLILEARDSRNEISFTLKEITRNDDADVTTRSFLRDAYSINTQEKDLLKANRAFVMDPEGVMSAQAPNARLMVKNLDKPGDKTVVKIRKYNPMER